MKFRPQQQQVTVVDGDDDDLKATAKILIQQKSELLGMYGMGWWLYDDHTYGKDDGGIDNEDSQIRVHSAVHTFQEMAWVIVIKWERCGGNGI